MLKTVVLLSGGVDSATCLGVAVKMYGAENVTALSIYYGQKHKKELECARALCKHYGVNQYEKNLSDVFFASDCSLLQHSPEAIPEGSYAEQQKGIEVPVSTYVPFRNGLFLSCAASIALSLGASSLFYGAHMDDACGQAYPDCSKEFVRAMSSAINLGSGNDLLLITPYVSSTKSQIVKDGLELGVPYELTWSCYSGNDKPCGKCGTCIDRAKAFEANGVEDPALSKGGK